MKKNPLKTILGIILLLLAIILGKLLGEACAGVPFLAWLNMGSQFSLSPTTLNLAVFSLTFGVSIGINIAQGLFLVLAIILSVIIPIKE